jgi:methylphosphotriester-DNA--protein-cysteine methyltransferase
MKSILVFLLWLTFTFISVSQTVYVTKTGKKYHESSCGSLSKSSFSLTLDEAVQQGYTACKRCNPTTSVSGSTTNEIKTVVPKTETQTKKKESNRYSTRCIATTKKGSQCKRNAQSGSNYCWQHN